MTRQLDDVLELSDIHVASVAGDIILHGRLRPPLASPATPHPVSHHTSDPMHVDGGPVEEGTFRSPPSLNQGEEGIAQRASAEIPDPPTPSWLHGPFSRSSVLPAAFTKTDLTKPRPRVTLLMDDEGDGGCTRGEKDHHSGVCADGT